MIVFFTILALAPSCHPSEGWDPGQRGLQKQQVFRQNNIFFYFCSVVSIFRNLINLAWVPAFAGMTILSAFAMSDDLWDQIIAHEECNEKELAIVVPTYNNSRWCIKNISSILAQKYENYHVYIIDDSSTDDTFQKLYDYLENHPLNYKVTLRQNTVRRGAMANWYDTISELADHVIVLNIDGDDWLAHDFVFMHVNAVYADKRIWMTYGQFKVWPGEYKGFCKRHAPRVIRKHNYRYSDWLSSHLRTYYAWLFKEIEVEDFKYDGVFLPTTCDRAMMYPLLEMCAGHYYCFEDEVLYVYNAQNPLADVRRNCALQQKMCGYIMSRAPYAPLADVLVTL